MGDHEDQLREDTGGALTSCNELFCGTHPETGEYHCDTETEGSNYCLDDSFIVKLGAPPGWFTGVCMDTCFCSEQTVEAEDAPESLQTYEVQATMTLAGVTEEEFADPDVQAGWKAALASGLDGVRKEDIVIYSFSAARRASLTVEYAIIVYSQDAAEAASDDLSEYVESPAFTAALETELQEELPDLEIGGVESSGGTYEATSLSTPSGMTGDVLKLELYSSNGECPLATSNPAWFGKVHTGVCNKGSFGTGSSWKAECSQILEYSNADCTGTVTTVYSGPGCDGPLTGECVDSEECWAINVGSPSDYMAVDSNTCFDSVDDTYASMKVDCDSTGQASAFFYATASCGGTPILSYKMSLPYTHPSSQIMYSSCAEKAFCFLSLEEMIAIIVGAVLGVCCGLCCCVGGIIMFFMMMKKSDKVAPEQQQQHIIVQEVPQQPQVIVQQAPPQAAVSPTWTEHWDQTHNRNYWHNAATGETTWTN